jgi:hypothetical protein
MASDVGISSVALARLVSENPSTSAWRPVFTTDSRGRSAWSAERL